MIVRRFECAGCGAAGEFREGALIVLCRYCGSFLAVETGAMTGEALVRLARAERGALAAPDKARARLMTLLADMGDCLARGDRAAWRALAEEQLALRLATDPSLAASAQSPEERAAWLKSSAEAMELSSFEPLAIEAQGSYARAANALLGAADPVEAARSLLEAARAYCRAIGQDSERQALEMVRAAVASYASVLGEGVSRRIRLEVLGDRDVSSPVAGVCPRCGATLAEPAEGRRIVSCAHCGAAADRASQDPWLEGARAFWRLTLDELRRTGGVRGPGPALGALSQIMLPFQRGGTVSPDTAWALLEECVPWLPAADLEQALRLLMGVSENTPAGAALLRSLFERMPRWVPDPSKTPAPWTEEEGPEPAGEAWVEQSLALLRLGGREDPQTLLGLCLTPFHLGGSVSVDRAWSFLTKAAPGADSAALLEALEVFRLGFKDHPEIAPFLDGLKARLERVR